MHATFDLLNLLALDRAFGPELIALINTPGPEQHLRGLRIRADARRHANSTTAVWLTRVTRGTVGGLAAGLSTSAPNSWRTDLVAIDIR